MDIEKAPAPALLPANEEDDLLLSPPSPSHLKKVIEDPYEVL
jgi:hypothetical protein